MASPEIETAVQPTGANQAADSGETPDTSSVESTALYEDRYLLVTKKGITIRRYYFPFMSDKFVPWEQIEYVKTAQELGVRWYEIKEWGIAIGDIWWNCGWRFIKNPFQDGWGVNSMEYILRTNIVIKVKDSSTRPGSYVENLDKAMPEITKIMQQHHSHIE
ncbi:hypothetical protein GGI19_000282 [Coemansia pectinata]|uniref:Uncharacterized protein n=1 Tax=Coemansia pectinata TaxID=1052879 RepID=A0A9W8LEB4_9FUNG|nr:hypothetical protein GGI19_000282 [Coemansia pectinata]